MRAEERLLFEAFIQTQPEFAGSRIRAWQPGNDPPDVLCVDDAGARVAVELAEWLDKKRSSCPLTWTASK